MITSVENWTRLPLADVYVRKKSSAGMENFKSTSSLRKILGDIKHIDGIINGDIKYSLKRGPFFYFYFPTKRSWNLESLYVNKRKVFASCK